jgi:hypothetical protein
LEREIYLEQTIPFGPTTEKLYTTIAPRYENAEHAKLQFQKSMVEQSNENSLEQMVDVFPVRMLQAQLGRRFFRTTKGWIGIGPKDMYLEYRLCIFFGGQTPYIIRENPGAEPGNWHFVGECCVSGLMWDDHLENLKMEEPDIQEKSFKLT